MVEHNLAKVGVASSNLVSRSKLERCWPWYFTGVFTLGTAVLVHWLSGRVVMQRPAKPLTSVRFRAQPPFSSPQCGHLSINFYFHLLSPGGEIGRRKGLKIPRWQHRAGSIPALGTILYFSDRFRSFQINSFVHYKSINQ